ncbi:hypothetical protein WJX72_004214 [[Myrmecia] bisecta]|uniref:Protein kinase domain-containing protein n=1 Tax=[Myrmecia] bisecta TaxID=41462 RepID=A0AAW1PXB3_9CHLO
MIQLATYHHASTTASAPFCWARNGVHSANQPSHSQGLYVNTPERLVYDRGFDTAVSEWCAADDTEALQNCCSVPLTLYAYGQHSGETACNVAFFTSFLQPLNSILYAEGLLETAAFIAPAGSPRADTVSGLQPDFQFKPHNRPVGEGKTPDKLVLPADDLTEACRRDPSIRSYLDQEWTYILAYESYFGWLTSQDQTLFIMQGGIVSDLRGLPMVDFKELHRFKAIAYTESGSIGLGSYKGMDCAIKAIDLDTDDNIPMRREAFFLGQLQGLYCVPTLLFFGLTWWGASLCIVMSYIEGRHLKTDGSEPSQVRDSARAGLSDIHARTILHGDIRSPNIIVTPDLRVVFIDYDRAQHLARLADAEAEQHQLQALLNGPASP